MRLLLNLNETVKVRLTEAGRKIMRAWVLKGSPDGGSFIPQWMVNKYLGAEVSIQLHELMHVFGPHTTVGMPNLFEGNDVEASLG